MGIDLHAMASHFREKRGELFVTANLRFDRDFWLQAIFSPESARCIVQPLPEGLQVAYFSDGGLELKDKDSYGKALTFTTPEKLRTVHVPDDFAEWNRAIFAFLLALPPGTRIVLFWC